MHDIKNTIHDISKGIRDIMKSFRDMYTSWIVITHINNSKLNKNSNS